MCWDGSGGGRLDACATLREARSLRYNAPISPPKWFSRKFDFSFDVDWFPLILERLRGTPGRLEERTSAASPAALTRRQNDSWSIQENAGHLVDLEPLWLGRVEDLLSGKAELRPADLTNAATHNARHNEKPIGEILGAFRQLRLQLVHRLEGMDETKALLTALHPRLKTPMRTIDLAYFVAEHDDHHLCRITQLLAAGEKSPK